MKYSLIYSLKYSLISKTVSHKTKVAFATGRFELSELSASSLQLGLNLMLNTIMPTNKLRCD